MQYILQTAVDYQTEDIVDYKIFNNLQLFVNIFVINNNLLLSLSTTVCY